MSNPVNTYTGVAAGGCVAGGGAPGPVGRALPIFLSSWGRSA